MCHLQIPLPFPAGAAHSSRVAGCKGPHTFRLTAADLQSLFSVSKRPHLPEELLGGVVSGMLQLHYMLANLVSDF